FLTHRPCHPRPLGPCLAPLCRLPCPTPQAAPENPAMRPFVVCLVSALLLWPSTGRANDLPVIEKVEGQPLGAQAQRLIDAMDYLGAPLPAQQKEVLQRAINDRDSMAIQRALDPLCIAGVRLNREGK